MYSQEDFLILIVAPGVAVNHIKETIGVTVTQLAGVIKYQKLSI
jgi:hypothetical protein